MRSGSTGAQSTSERERLSITGPNHIACDRIQDPRALRQASCALCKFAAVGLPQSVCSESRSALISAAAVSKRGTITSAVKLTSTSCREAVGAAAAGGADTGGAVVAGAEAAGDAEAHPAAIGSASAPTASISAFHIRITTPPRNAARLPAARA